MFLKNLSLLRGNQLEYTQSIDVKTSGQTITKIKQKLFLSKDNAIDCQGLLLIPGLINAHTHIGDSIAKDISLNQNVDARIHPVFGIKSKVLTKSSPPHIATFMKNACKSMVKKGITTFVDFREGGLEGIHILKKAISTVPIRSIILGRVDYYQSENQIRENIPLPKSKQEELFSVLKKCDGIGVSGTNENSNNVLKQLGKSNKIRAIHSSETIESSKISKKLTRKTETQRSLLLKPHFLVHMTYATNNDLRLAANKTRGIVICPRANASLAEGIPNILTMKKFGCNIAIGTDNVMINSPDMFREMDYLWKLTMGINRKQLAPIEILKMVTVNAGKIFHKKIGVIDVGNLADGVFIDKHAIDLEPMHNPYASIVHRVSDSSIRAVMIGGKIVHGKI